MSLGLLVYMHSPLAKLIADFWVVVGLKIGQSIFPGGRDGKDGSMRESLMILLHAECSLTLDVHLSRQEIPVYWLVQAVYGEELEV